MRFISTADFDLILNWTPFIVWNAYFTQFIKVQSAVTN
jgi:hypothetical protein